MALRQTSQLTYHYYYYYYYYQYYYYSSYSYYYSYLLTFQSPGPCFQRNGWDAPPAPRSAQSRPSSAHAPAAPTAVVAVAAQPAAARALTTAPLGGGDCLSSMTSGLAATKQA